MYYLAKEIFYKVIIILQFFLFARNKKNDKTLYFYKSLFKFFYKTIFLFLMKSKAKNYIITAGGTGGHIFPALSLCERIIKRESRNAKIFFVTDERFTDDYKAKYQKLFDTGLVAIVRLPVRSFNKKKIFSFGYALITSIVKSFALVLTKKPRFIFGFGGYASLPSLTCGVLLGKKILLHEQNAVIGRVTDWFLPFASRLFTTFKNTEGVAKKYQAKTSVSGMIFSQKMLKCKIQEKQIDFKNNTYNIFILGGSLGSTVFASSLAHWLGEICKADNELSNKKICVFHQINKKHESIIVELETIYKSANLDAVIKTFFTNPEEVMLSTNLLISRAGAGAVCEAMLFNTNTILVPIKHAIKNHQLKNANLASKAKGNIITIEEDEFNHTSLQNAILKLKS